MSADITAPVYEYVGFLFVITTDAAGAPEHAEFSPHCGLCTNAPDDAAYDLRDVLVADFGDDDTPFSTPDTPFTTCTPFDTPDREYWQDSAAGTHHTNPLRLAWVRAQLAKPTGD